MAEILFCRACNKFTMMNICSCTQKTISILPQKYSPEKLLEYRIKAKRGILEERGLL